MTSKPIDRRILRTRRALRDALIALILERGYDSMTVQDITDQADLSRATFYLHYKDKEELLVSSLEEIYDDLVARVEPFTQEGLLGGETPSLIAFQHAQEHADLYKILLAGHGSARIAQRVRRYLAGTISQRLAPIIPPQGSPIAVELLANHMAGSLLGLIMWWLESDLPHPPEFMAETFQRLHVPTLMALFGIDPPNRDKPR